MKVTSTRKRLLARLSAKGRQLASLTPADGIAEMLSFYQDERAEGCEIAEDGDMLLYQWGSYDWGQGRSFDLNITRQFTEGEDVDIRQLSLTFKFKTSELLERLEAGNLWCASPDGVDEFRSFIETSGAYVTVRPEQVSGVTLELNRI